MSIYTENQIYNLERLVEKLSCKISEMEDDQDFLLDKIVDLESRLSIQEKTKNKKPKPKPNKLYWFKYRVKNVNAGPFDMTGPYLTNWSKKKVAANSEKEAKILFGLTDADYVYDWQKKEIK